MKTFRNRNFKKNTINFIVFCLMILIYYSCKDNQSSIILPQAEITNIYNITDSTAQVDIQVTQQSNAADQAFGLNVDTMSLTGNLMKIQVITLTPNGATKLNSNYSISISKLNSNKEYYISLVFAGEFTIGGESQVENYTIGTTKTFTTK